MPDFQIEKPTDLTYIKCENLNDIIHKISEFIKKYPIGTNLTIEYENNAPQIEKIVKDYNKNGEKITLKKREMTIKPFYVNTKKNYKVIVGIQHLNLAKFIDKTITSIIDCVDKIVILDGGSTDNSIEVIKSFDSKKIDLILFPQEKNYTTTRNVILERVRDLDPEWFFKIDSDEEMASGFKNKIDDILKTDGDIFNLPILWLSNNNPIQYVASNYHTKLAPYRDRIFRWHESIEYDRSPHRNVHDFLKTPWPFKRILNINDMDAAIYHYIYILQSYQDRIEKMKRYDNWAPGSGKGSEEAYLYEHYPHEIRGLDKFFLDPLGEKNEQDHSINSNK